MNPSPQLLKELSHVWSHMLKTHKHTHWQKVCRPFVSFHVSYMSWHQNHPCGSNTVHIFLTEEGFALYLLHIWGTASRALPPCEPIGGCGASNDRICVKTGMCKVRRKLMQRLMELKINLNIHKNAEQTVKKCLTREWMRLCVQPCTSC